MMVSVDERFPISFYFRIANRLVKQAKVYREETNLGDLFLTLRQYTRLMTEIIPHHRSYSEHPSKEKLRHKKILQEFVKELENLKPLLGRHDNEGGEQVGTISDLNKDVSMQACHRWTAKVQSFKGFVGRRVKDCSSTSKSHRMDSTNWATDTTPDAKICCKPSQSTFPLTITTAGDDISKVHVVKHHFPSVISWIEDPPLVGQVAHVTTPEQENEHFEPLRQQASTSNAFHDVHLSERLMEEFMGLAKENTQKNLETCGILGAFLKNHTLYVTTLIVPKQESSSNSCQASNEEEIHAILDEQSLFPAGWIHTHPSQTCFLSSIDLHTQYSYQVMLPDAIAIVMAPTDPMRNYGIFRLTDPGGIDVLRECKEGGFHQHPETADGTPIYESCSNIFFNRNLRFEIIDLRTLSP